jgi:hypothetical protein
MRAKERNESNAVFGEREAESAGRERSPLRGLLAGDKDTERCGIAELRCPRSGRNEEGAPVSRTAGSRRVDWQRRNETHVREQAVRSRAGSRTASSALVLCDRGGSVSSKARLADSCSSA